jgi:hypothetical protein
MNKSILLTPANETVINELTDNLKSSLDSIFSFSPNSKEKLEAVALGVIGYPNGRQQWKAQKELQPILLSSIASGSEGAAMKTLLNHPDPLVRAFAAGISQSLEDCFVLIFDSSDFDGVPYSDVFDAEDIKKAVKLLESNYDNTNGVTNETIVYVAEEIINSKVFVSPQYGTIKYGYGAGSGYQWVNERNECFELESDFVDNGGSDGDEILTWLSPVGEGLSHEDGILAGKDGVWQYAEA